MSKMKGGALASCCLVKESGVLALQTEERVKDSLTLSGYFHLTKVRKMIHPTTGELPLGNS